MNYTILFYTQEFRGDHAADVQVSITPKENETLEDLIKRVPLNSHFDKIEIRLTMEAVPFR